MSMKPTAPDPATPAANTTGGGFSLRPSKQTVIVLGSLILVTLIGTAGFASWQLTQKQERDGVISKKTQQVNDSTFVAKQLGAKEAEYSLVRNRIGRLETSVSEGDYVPTLMKQLENLAKTNSLRIVSQSQTFEPAPEPPVDKEARKTFVSQPYDKEIITLVVKGRYNDLTRFLYRLTEFPKILSVDTLDIKPEGTDSGQSPLLSVTINMTGYLFKPEESAEPAPEAAPTMQMPQITEPVPVKRREI
ncbi:MAG: type 4a pilus biogenesis protein PilO [Armatimonadetes bacterium]|nr:type 4a pilus biogenesis protein PilO [Armatimonadota bacterium]